MGSSVVPVVLFQGHYDDHCADVILSNNGTQSHDSNKSNVSNIHIT